ncbi:MAG: MurR/RpiR family transcriptional regulator [Blautia sp.]
MIPLLEQAHSYPLTDMEKNILSYFEDNLATAVFMNLEELSQALFTSNATVVRFCKKIGLNGFNEFKYELKKELSLSIHTSLSSDNLLKHSLASFKDNMASIDFKSLRAISDLLMSDRPLYIYGAGLSSIPARYLQIILTALDRPCILVELRDLMEAITYYIKEDAVLFIITTHGDALRYMQIFEKAKQHGTTIILITCEEDSPLHPYSNISVVTNDENQKYHNIDLNYRIGIITVIQILIEMIADRRPSNLS